MLAECELCHKWKSCDKPHHVFNGADKERSEKYDAMILLCCDCHREIHMNPKKMQELKEIYQKIIMKEFDISLEQWLQEFKKSWIRSDQDGA